MPAGTLRSASTRPTSTPNLCACPISAGTFCPREQLHAVRLNVLHCSLHGASLSLRRGPHLVEELRSCSWQRRSFARCCCRQPSLRALTTAIRLALFHLFIINPMLASSLAESATLAPRGVCGSRERSTATRRGAMLVTVPHRFSSVMETALHRASQNCTRPCFVTPKARLCFRARSLPQPCLRRPRPQRPNCGFGASSCLISTSRLTVPRLAPARAPPRFSLGPVVSCTRSNRRRRVVLCPFRPSATNSAARRVG